MKVVSYYNVIPSKNKSEEKFNILRKFVQGVNSAGDIGVLYQGYELQQCDVGMIQGWQHEQGKNLPHLQLRQRVIDCSSNTHVCTADSNLFLYANKTNSPYHYLRYSFDGVFPNTGNYFDDNIDPTRWQQISRDLNIKLEEPKNNGKHILICAQRNGGWSLGKINLDNWLLDTCNKIRQYTDRPVLVRLHPSDNQTNRRAPQIQQLLDKISNVTISSNNELDKDLENCHAVVNHNSSSIVGPIIKGYNAFITDATKSQCAEVANTDFSKLESPSHFDRQSWLERISMFHWKFSEVEDGSAWRHMRNYVRQ